MFVSAVLQLFNQPIESNFNMSNQHEFFRASLRILSIQQKGQVTCYPTIPKIDKSTLLASTLPPRSLDEKAKQPQFSVMKRSGRYMRSLYGSQVKV